MIKRGKYMGVYSAIYLYFSIVFQKFFIIVNVCYLQWFLAKNRTCTKV